MKVVTDNLSELLNQKTSDQQAKIVEEKKLTDKEFQTLAHSAISSDVYHKSTPEDDPTYNRPMVITSHRSELELQRKMAEKIDNGEMAVKLFSISDDINDLVSQLEQSQPSLANKDWGFSVNEENKLVATGNISENEKLAIETAFNSNEKVVRVAKQIPDIFLEGQEYDRGYDGKGDSWGKYDVTRENFSEVIDLKALLDDSYFGDHKEKGYLHVFNFGDGLRAQLANNADVKFGH